MLKNIYYSLVSLLPIGLLRNAGPHRILLPYHHLVSDSTQPHIEHLYPFKNVAAFKKDIDYLIQHFNPIHPDELYQLVIQNKPVPAGSFLLSFDDGLSQVYHIIAPILKEKNIPAIFFINPNFVDNRQLFYRCKISLLIAELIKHPQQQTIYTQLLQIANKSIENTSEVLRKINQNNSYLLDELAQKINFSFEDYLNNTRPFLTREQILTLHNQGFSIGAHSMNHPYYSLLSADEQVEQTLQSCEYVKKLTGQDTCHFSFPHSDKAIRVATIQKILEGNNGLLFGIQNQRLELQHQIMHRFNAERPGIPFHQLVKGQIVFNHLEKITGRYQISRQ